ncbi:MAG: hypothetical protein SNJ54_11400 [Anaerolineae bacterium]
MKPLPPDDSHSRTGELPRIPTEVELHVEAAAPSLLELTDAPDVRSMTGVHRLNVETHEDAPRDVDKPTPREDSPA